MSTTKTQQARNEQSKASKRATLDKLLSKKLAEKEITIEIDGEELTLLFRAISMPAYDKLLEKHPPTKKQRDEGATYNLDTFPPALVAECLVEPELDYEAAKAIWESESWSRGDVLLLWETAMMLCVQGFNVPFTSRG